MAADQIHVFRFDPGALHQLYRGCGEDFAQEETELADFGAGRLFPAPFRTRCGNLRGGDGAGSGRRRRKPLTSFIKAPFTTL